MQLEDGIKQEKFGSEQEKALLNILFTSSWLNTKQLRFFKQFDLSPQQYNVLRILRGQYPELVSVSLIQDRMLDKMSNVSRLVEKLKQRKLLKRNECPNDRRQMDVMISEEGLALLKVIDGVTGEMHEIMNCISPDQARLLNELLDKIKSKD